MTVELFRIGFEAPLALIPPIPENTAYAEEGSLRIGVEFRVLNDQVVLDTLGVAPPETAKGVDSRGLCVHVFDALTGGEHLRFDVFDGEPHYHYMNPGTLNRVVPFDEVGCGDMWAWTLDCLRHRLQPMLRRAGATELADKITTSDLEALVPQVEELAGAALARTSG